MNQMNLKNNQFLKDFLKGIFVIFIICGLPWIISYWISFFEAIAFWLDIAFLYHLTHKEKKYYSSKFLEVVMTLGEYSYIKSLKEYFSMVNGAFVPTMIVIISLLVMIAILGGILGILVFGWKQLL